ncbi:putative assembly protein [Haemophilus influenzae]|nr:putative assembly protein [Haemophilus influenzae]
MYGNAALHSLNIQQLKLTQNTQNPANVSIEISPFSLKQLLSKKVILNGENHIRIEFNKPIYGKTKTFHFSFHKANLDFSTSESAPLQFVDASLNNQPIGYIETHTAHQQIVTYIKPQCDNDCLAVLKYQQIDNQSAVNFSGKYFPVQRLFALLNLPEMLSGHADFDLDLNFSSSSLIQGKLNFLAQNGEILGVNLLDMVAQYFPINYNNDLLKNKELNTRFEQFYLQLSLQQHQLQAEKIELKTPALLGQGKGIIDLNRMECNVDINLNSTDQRYQNLTLPINFFGNCNSPQYKINFTKKFRHQLIDAIKEKLR